MNRRLTERGKERRRLVREMLELVELSGLETRMPHELSGGQQQRVALARALAPRPAVLLLDEPFSNLDADLRGMMRVQVREILNRVGTTALFVTHDQEEALFMGDRVAVMRAGRLEQVAEPPELYLAPATRGVIAGGLMFADRGIDLSRSFKALKAWMMIKAYGLDTFARIVEKNVEQCRYLAELVEAHRELELLAPVPLNLVVFRYVGGGDLAEPRLNGLNHELLLRLHESGLAVPSGTLIDGKYAIRVANCNHRSRREDFQILVEAVVMIGRDLR